jgi:hypothetical protein
VILYNVIFNWSVLVGFVYLFCLHSDGAINVDNCVVGIVDIQLTRKMYCLAVDCSFFDILLYVILNQVFENPIIILHRLAVHSNNLLYIQYIYI